MTNSSTHPKEPADGQLTAFADHIRRELAVAETHMRQGLEHAIRAGELLAQVKSLLPHGEWLPWVESNLPIAPRQAQRYMFLAEHKDELRNATSGSHLTISGAVALVAERRHSPPPPPAPRKQRVSYAQRAVATTMAKTYRWRPGGSPGEGNVRPFLPSDEVDEHEHSPARRVVVTYCQCGVKLSEEELGDPHAVGWTR